MLFAFRVAQHQRQRGVLRWHKHHKSARNGKTKILFSTPFTGRCDLYIAVAEKH